MKNKTNNEIKSPKQIIITERPIEIEIEDLEIIANQCQDNSLKVINKYNQVNYIEGVLLIIDKNKKAKAMCHAWNEVDNFHFDVTKEVLWNGDVFNQIEEKKYMAVKIFSLDESSDVNNFTEETKQIVKEMNEELSDGLERHFILW